jgi:hypothetical protein
LIGPSGFASTEDTSDYIQNSYTQCKLDLSFLQTQAKCDKQILKIIKLKKLNK